MTTRARTTLPALDQEAMNTTDTARLRELCQQGSNLACQFANQPVPTQAELDDMAARRDAQAQADRAATAQRLLNVGVNPIIADAVRTGRDVHYARDREHAEQIRKSLTPTATSSESFYQAFYNKHRTAIWVGGGAVGLLGALLLARGILL